MLQFNGGQLPINKVPVEHTDLGNESRLGRSCHCGAAAVCCGISDSYWVESPIATATAAIMHQRCIWCRFAAPESNEDLAHTCGHFTCDRAYKTHESLQIWSTTQTLRPSMSLSLECLHERLQSPAPSAPTALLGIGSPRQMPAHARRSGAQPLPRIKAPHFCAVADAN